jgi:caa(3)-type oxidase subunit IV
MSEKDETKDSEKPSSESEAKPTAAEKAAAAAVTDESEERDDEDEDDDEEDSDPNAREAKHGPGSADHGTPAKSDVHGHGHAHGGHDDHGLAHTTPVSLLVGILAALMFLTIVTVAVTKIDLGSQGNLIVAMVIATIKAGLVVTFFMHLLWDKKFHLILFLTSVLFLILFMSLSINDRSEYEADIETYRAAQAQPK